MKNKFINEFEFKVNQIKNIEKKAIQQEQKRILKIIDEKTKKEK